MKEIIKVSNLNYKLLLKDINLVFYENTFNLIAGPNKCGKSTLIKILSGMIEINNTCFYQKKDISTLSSLEFSKIFSYLFEDAPFSFHFQKVKEEILYYIDKTNYSQSERKMKARNLIRIFNLQEKQDEKIEKLSYFEKVKVKVLCSIVSTPKILLLDNIFDSLLEEEVDELFRILKKVGGMTIIVSSNTLMTAYLFDNIIILNKSNVLLSGPPLEVLQEDSTLNKLGLPLPFMIDLSIKLKYYGLVENILLDMDRMVKKLWN